MKKIDPAAIVAGKRLSEDVSGQEQAVPGKKDQAEVHLFHVCCGLFYRKGMRHSCKKQNIINYILRPILNYFKLIIYRIISLFLHVDINI